LAASVVAETKPTSDSPSQEESKPQKQDRSQTRLPPHARRKLKVAANAAIQAVVTPLPPEPPPDKPVPVLLVPQKSAVAKPITPMRPKPEYVDKDALVRNGRYVPERKNKKFSRDREVLETEAQLAERDAPSPVGELVKLDRQFTKLNLMSHLKPAQRHLVNADCAAYRIRKNARKKILAVDTELDRVDAGLRKSGKKSAKHKEHEDEKVDLEKLKAALLLRSRIPKVVSILGDTAIAQFDAALARFRRGRGARPSIKLEAAANMEKTNLRLKQFEEERKHPKKKVTPVKGERKKTVRNRQLVGVEINPGPTREQEWLDAHTDADSAFDCLGKILARNSKPYEELAPPARMRLSSLHHDVHKIWSQCMYCSYFCSSPLMPPLVLGVPETWENHFQSDQEHGELREWHRNHHLEMFRRKARIAEQKNLVGIEPNPGPHSDCAAGGVNCFECDNPGKACRYTSHFHRRPKGKKLHGAARRIAQKNQRKLPVWLPCPFCTAECPVPEHGHCQHQHHDRTLTPIVPTGDALDIVIDWFVPPSGEWNEAEGAWSLAQMQKMLKTGADLQAFGEALRRDGAPPGFINNVTHGSPSGGDLPVFDDDSDDEILEARGRQDVPHVVVPPLVREMFAYQMAHPEMHPDQAHVRFLELHRLTDADLPPVHRLPPAPAAQRPGPVRPVVFLRHPNALQVIPPVPLVGPAAPLPAAPVPQVVREPVPVEPVPLPVQPQPDVAQPILAPLVVAPGNPEVVVVEPVVVPVPPPVVVPELPAAVVADAVDPPGPPMQPVVEQPLAAPIPAVPQPLFGGAPLWDEMPFPPPIQPIPPPVVDPAFLPLPPLPHWVPPPAMLVQPPVELPPLPEFDLPPLENEVMLPDDDDDLILPPLPVAVLPPPPLLPPAAHPVGPQPMPPPPPPGPVVHPHPLPPLPPGPPGPPLLPPVYHPPVPPPIEGNLHGAQFLPYAQYVVPDPAEPAFHQIAKARIFLAEDSQKLTFWAEVADFFKKIPFIGSDDPRLVTDQVVDAYRREVITVFGFHWSTSGQVMLDVARKMQYSHVVVAEVHLTLLRFLMSSVAPPSMFVEKDGVTSLNRHAWQFLTGTLTREYGRTDLYKHLNGTSIYFWTIACAINLWVFRQYPVMAACGGAQNFHTATRSVI
jgi:hypothetical protein